MRKMIEEEVVVEMGVGSEVEIQSPKPAPLQDDMVLLDTTDEQTAGGTGRGVGGGGGGGEKKEQEAGIPERLERFYFESDPLVLKNNTDYQKMLKTLALLQAQKIQATKDLEQLMTVKNRALCDPHGFVSALKSGTLEELPMRQTVAELPDINWKGYTDSIERVVKQHSSIYQRTRRKGLPKETPVVSSRLIDTGRNISAAARHASYKQHWTPEEQMRLEELLKTYPSEAVERRRYEKIAQALSTRTTQQVASHVQKYFIKLAKAGLPVPGRMPNMSAYGPKGKKVGRAKRLSRPSTFFSTLTPRVYMSASSGSVSSSSYSPSPLEGEEEEEEDEEEEEEGDSSDSDESLLTEWVPTRHSDPASSSSSTNIQCVRCDVVVRYGRYWECSDCSVTSRTTLCSDCINSDYQTSHHDQSHEMIPHTLVNDPSDQDYSQFSQSTHRQYNYLDPNFYPAS